MFRQSDELCCLSLLRDNHQASRPARDVQRVGSFVCPKQQYVGLLEDVQIPDHISQVDFSDKGLARLDGHLGRTGVILGNIKSIGSPLGLETAKTMLSLMPHGKSACMIDRRG